MLTHFFLPSWFKRWGWPALFHFSHLGIFHTVCNMVNKSGNICKYIYCHNQKYILYREIASELRDSAQGFSMCKYINKSKFHSKCGTYIIARMAWSVRILNRKFIRSIASSFIFPMMDKSEDIEFRQQKWV